jgi:hypothetical protein
MVPLTVRTAVLCLASASCVDTAKPFDDFTKRLSDYQERVEREREQEQTDAGADAGACRPIDEKELEGRFLFAVAVAIDKSKPLLSTLEITRGKGKPGVFDAVIEMLTTDDPPKPTGLRVDTTITLEGNQFTLAKTHVVVPGEANTLQPGITAEADISSTGVLCARDAQPIAFVCGDIAGEITKPLTVPLDGSEFGALRAPEGEALPAPISTCSGWSGAP